jgi:glucose-1-phosphate thymidylyltransferase
MLDDIDRIPDIDEHIIVTNHKFAPIFEEWKQKEGRWQKPITIIDDGTETNETRLGAVCDLLLAIDYLSNSKSSNSKLSNSKWSNSKWSNSKSSNSKWSNSKWSNSKWSNGQIPSLLVVAADNLLFFSFQEFIDFAKEKGTSCIMCHEQPSIEKLQRTGVVEVDDNWKVLGMEEKPQHPKTHWAVPPFYVYREHDLDLVRHSVENGCGKDAPGNLAHYMVEHTTMHAWPMSAGRFDIGSLDTYHEAIEKYG